MLLAGRLPPSAEGYGVTSRRAKAAVVIELWVNFYLCQPISDKSAVQSIQRRIDMGEVDTHLLN